MSVYKFGASKNGGYRVLLPADDERSAKQQRGIGPLLAFGLGMVIGASGYAFACTLLEDQGRPFASAKTAQ